MTFIKGLIILYKRHHCLHSEIYNVMPAGRKSIQKSIYRFQVLIINKGGVMRVDKKIIVLTMIAFQSITLWAFDYSNLKAKYVVDNEQNGTATNEVQSGTSDSNSKVSPQNQSNKPSDIEITKKIRKEIMATNGMSMNAKNVKIITMNGKVTLRGMVDSEKEKSTINQFATNVAGPENVVNELQVNDKTNN